MSPQISCAVVWVFLQQWIISTWIADLPNVSRIVTCYVIIVLPKTRANIPCNLQAGLSTLIIRPSAVRGEWANLGHRLARQLLEFWQRTLTLACSTSSHCVATVRESLERFLARPKIVCFFVFFNKMTGYNELIVWTSCFRSCPSACWFLGNCFTSL